MNFNLCGSFLKLVDNFAACPTFINVLLGTNK